MLLQGLTGGNAVVGPACELVISVDGRINFFVSQSEASRGASPLQLLEELLRQFIRIAGETFARVEHAEKIQTAAANFHQFFNGDIPTSD